ncbi:hypothetical protein AG1IA_05004 [Rhizoctonia solani AG-1 IA]|uniref:Uncharacterized protein n=1 Tax=Thanatephorus cucumeris (strain AG1-IA) TaxID=983506 RepID=L8WVX3_THACA|nr:hypothetical protein AG1IA_05004 [Rhizoctonia solani AG-1 IA]
MREHVTAISQVRFEGSAPNFKIEHVECCDISRTLAVTVDLSVKCACESADSESGSTSTSARLARTKEYNNFRIASRGHFVSVRDGNDRQITVFLVTHASCTRNPGTYESPPIHQFYTGSCLMSQLLPLLRLLEPRIF